MANDPAHQRAAQRGLAGNEQIPHRSAAPTAALVDTESDGGFETDEEWEAFIAWLYVERRTNLA